MSSRALLHAFFDCLRDLDHSIDRCLDLFADDGVFEFPYFAVLGMPTQFRGKDELRRVLETINARFSAFTERVYAQDYVTQLVAENGKIKLLREYFNVIRTARALLPNGLADVPAAD